MVNHIMKRWEGAIEPRNITQLENKGEFKVRSALSTKIYLVRFGNKSTYPSCQCLDWQKHRLPCKHFCAIFQHTQWKWESLSLLYKNNPLFCLDDFCFTCIGSMNDHKLPENKQTQCNNKNENCEVIDCADGKSEVPDISYHNDALDNGHTQIKFDQHNGEGFTELPSRNVFRTTQHKKKCREILKQLTSATYLLKDISSIQDLEQSLCKIWEDVKESLPSDCNGLALETNDKPKCKRKATSPTEENKSARKKRKIQLPKGKYGRPKHRYTGRVGQTAEMLRKTYKVNIPVKSFNESTLLKKENNSLKHRPKTWIADLHLTVSDENVLLTSNGWLSDKHINASQFIMKSQFPSLEGFVDTLLVSCGKVRNPIEKSGIQIHNLNIKHWVMSAFMNGTLTVYDSLYLNFSASLVKQLKAVYPHLSKGAPNPIVKLVRPQLQSNFNDCGLFAVANCVAIANGIDPASIKFHQSQMRSHLHTCFKSKTLTMFPHSKQPNNHKPAYKIVKFIS